MVVSGQLTQVRALREPALLPFRQDLTLRNEDLEPILNLQASPLTI